MLYDISVLPLYVNCRSSPVGGIIDKLISNPTNLKNLEDINQYFSIKMKTLNSINEDIPSCRDANAFFREKHTEVFLSINDSIGIRIFSDFFLSIIPKKFIE